MGLGRFRRRDDRPGEQRPPDPDLAEALARARGAAEGGVSSGEHRRRMAAALEGTSVDDLAAAAAALSSALGAAPAGDARLAALERLTEAPRRRGVSDEDFARERRRLLGEG